MPHFQIFLSKEIPTTLQRNVTPNCAPCVYRHNQEVEIHLHSVNSRSCPNSEVPILFLTTLKSSSLSA